jgi:Mrp family chromosome partitioning ATPase
MQSVNGRPAPSQTFDPAAVVNVEMQLLESLEVHRAVVTRRLGPGATRDDIDRGLARFESKLHVTKATDANVIELSYTDSDPKEAANALRMLLKEYFETRANVLTSGRVGYLVAQRDKVKVQLDAANASIANLLRRNNVADVTAQIAGAVEQDQLLRQQKLEAEAALADNRQSLARLRSAGRAIPAQVELYSDNTEAARSIGEMQASLLALQSSGPTSPRAIWSALRWWRSRTDRSRACRPRSSSRSAAWSRPAEPAATNISTPPATAWCRRGKHGRGRARSRTLDQQIAASGRRLARLIAVGDEVARLRLERDVLADSFRALSNQVGQARVQLNQAAGAGSPNVRVIQAPARPIARSNPPLLLIAGSVVAAILVSMTALVLLSSVRDTFLTPSEVQRALGLRVLCAPFRRADEQPGEQQREFDRVAATIGNGEADQGRTLLLLAPSSRMSLQEAALGLGDALNRRAPGTVMLLRFDRGKPVPADGETLQSHDLNGIPTAVVGLEAWATKGAAVKLLSDLKQRFEHVVVTAPPTSESFESVQMAHAADVVLMVVQAESTRQPVARDLLAQVQHMGKAVAGVILLGRRQYIPQWLYRIAIERGNPLS